MGKSTDILAELEWRGLRADCTDVDGLRAEIAKGPITVYVGFDPSADSLHIGNLVPLLVLRRFQEFGHHVIALAGGSTGMIGDPGGRSQERNLLSEEVLRSNVAKIKEQMRGLLDFNRPGNPAQLLDNYDWTKGVSYLDFLRDVGKHMTVNWMVAKESVRTRMEDRATGISYTEFSYMLLQAYDFWWLNQNHNCVLQFGGTDQWGNITAGVELCRKRSERKVWGLTLPLITKADGTKFGKTAAGAVWLDGEKTSQNDFYQFWMRTDDRDVIQFLKYFTFLKQEEIQALEREHRENPEKRKAHEALANNVSALARPGAQGVGERANPFYEKDIVDIALRDFDYLWNYVPSLLIPQAEMEEGMSLSDALARSGLCSSKSEARREIEKGGVYINKEQQVKDAAYQLQASDLLYGKYILLRRGKKNYGIVRVE